MQRVVLITDPRFSIEHTTRVIEAASACEGLVVQLRDKENVNLEASARALREVTARTNAVFVVNAVGESSGGALDLAARVSADGAHVACTLQAIADARAAGFRWISVPAHTDDDVRIAEEGGATAALVSPIFASPGKGEPRGVAAIASALQVAKKTRIYALGGIDGRSRAAACRDAGAYGVAVLRALLELPDPAKAANVARELAGPSSRAAAFTRPILR